MQTLQLCKAHGTHVICWDSRSGNETALPYPDASQVVSIQLHHDEGCSVERGALPLRLR